MPTSATHACISVDGTYVVTLRREQFARGITLGGAVGTQTLRLVGGDFADAELRLAGQDAAVPAIAPNGALELASDQADWSSGVFIEGGTFVNRGTIRTLPGGYDRRFLHGPLVNLGTIEVGVTTFGRESWSLAEGSRITVGPGAQFFHQPLDGGTLVWEGGTIVNNGLFRVSGGGFRVVTGAVSGNAIEVSSVDDFQPSGTNSATFTLFGITTLTSDVEAGYTLDVVARPTVAILQTHAARTNRGTITLASTDLNTQAELKMWSGALTNEGTIRTLAGGHFERRIWGDLVNKGVIEIEKRTVSTAGSSWTNTGTIVVDPFVTLELSSLTNQVGSTLSGGTFVIRGTLRYPGANVLTNSASVELDAGAGGAAQLLEHNSGTNALANLGANSASGSFALRGGKTLGVAGPFSNAGTVTVGGPSKLTTSGDYTQSAGTTTVAGTLTAAGGRVRINGGSLSGTGLVEPGLTNGGVLAPGSSPGTITVAGTPGDYVQAAAAALTIEVTGAAPGTGYDRGVVAGAAALSGRLRVSTIGFTPSPGQTFEVLSASAVSGTFSDVEFVGPPYALRYTPTSVTLVAPGPTAVRAFGFAATPTAGGVRLRWSGGSPADVLGFNLYHQGRRRWFRLNRRLIGARASAFARDYLWIDRNGRRGDRYRLDSVRLDGEAGSTSTVTAR